MLAKRLNIWQKREVGGYYVLALVALKSEHEPGTSWLSA
jgi:hypothetical protein